MDDLFDKSLKGASFVDLDGTLLSGNSMRIFMKKLPVMLTRRHRYGKALKSLLWIAMRCVRLVSHKSMKWHLTKHARLGLTEEDWLAIASAMADKVNPKVAALIEKSREKGCVTFIATAAMEEYAYPLASLLGFEGAIATVFTDRFSDYKERRGEVKLNGIQDLLASDDLRLESFITDHEDDLPVAKEFPRFSIVVNPSRKTFARFNRVGVSRYLP